MEGFITPPLPHFEVERIKLSMAPSLQRHYSPSSLLRATPPSCLPSALFPCVLSYRTDPSPRISPWGKQDFSSFHRLLVPCRRQYPAGVNYPLSQSEIAHIVFTVVDRLDHRILIFTRLAQRSLTLQPSNSLISPRLTLSAGFNMSITLHAAAPFMRYGSRVCSSSRT
jgi:hypothetical protein